jgi:hypothetical protein
MGCTETAFEMTPANSHYHQSWKFVPSITIKTMQPETGRQVAVALYVVAMVAVIVGVDFAFFRNRFWERLIANIGIVLVFAAFYLRFFRRP